MVKITTCISASEQDDRFVVLSIFYGQGYHLLDCLWEVRLRRGSCHALVWSLLLMLFACSEQVDSLTKLCYIMSWDLIYKQCKTGPESCAHHFPRKHGSDKFNDIVAWLNT